MSLFKRLFGGPRKVNQEALNLALLTACQQCQTKTVQKYLNAGADVNGKDGHGRTPLMFAAFQGCTETVGVLLERGAGVNETAIAGTTALMLASDAGHLEIVELLVVNSANVNAQDINGWSALLMASRKGYTEIVRVLLDKKADPDAQNEDGTTALMFVTEHGYTKIARLLLDYGANPNLQNRFGSGALMIAADHNRLSIVEVLLAKNAEVNAKDKNGMTALLLAAQLCFSDIVKLLLDHRADISAKNRDGATVYDLAAWRGCEETTEVLRQAALSVKPGLVTDTDDFFEFIFSARRSQPSLHQITLAVMEFINADTWAERRTIIEAKHDELLTKEADDFLVYLLKETQDDLEVTHILKDCRIILSRCKEEGIESAFAVHLHSSAPEIVSDFLNHLETKLRNELLRHEDDSELFQMYRNYIEKILEQGNSEISPELLKNLIAFVGTNTWTDARSILEKHSEDLLSGNTDWLLGHLVESYQVQENPREAQNIEEHRLLLSRCRAVGIETAFSEFPPYLEEQDNPKRGTVPIPPEFLDNVRQAQNAVDQYKWRGDLNALDKAIAIWKGIVSSSDFLTLDLNFRLAVFNDAAGNYLARFYEANGEEKDLHQALDYLEQAITLTPPGSPNLPARLSNLGNALLNRYELTLDVTDLEKALKVFDQAVSETLPNAPELPNYLNGLGLVLINYYSVTMDVTYLKRGIQVLEKAMEQILPPTSRASATILTNLGNALRSHYLHTKDLSDLRRAIEAWEQAVERTPIDAPNRPALLNDLGSGLTTYYEQKKDLAIFERAEAVFQEAVSRTSPGTPYLSMYLSNLGDLFFYQENWSEASTTYIEAIKEGKLFFGNAYTDISRQAEIRRTSRTFSRAAFSLLQQKKTDKALLLLEQGKTRLMAETLVWGDVDLTLLPESRQKPTLNARQTLRKLEAERRLTPNSLARRSDSELTRLLREAWNELNEPIEGVQIEYPDFIPAGLDLSDLLELIPANGVLVAPFLTAKGGAVFVLPYGIETVTEKHFLWLDELTDDVFKQILIGSESDPGWLPVYLKFRTHPQVNEVAWYALVELIGQKLWQLLVNPIYDKLTALGLRSGAPLLLMPSSGLSLLPLHAAWRKVDGQSRSLLDDYPITYAPSGYILSISRRRVKEAQRQPRSLLAVVNPTKDLRYTPLEGEQVVNLFDEDQTVALNEDMATLKAVREAVQGHSYLHFSCHGYYNWQEAMQSGLVLANGERLTLARIISDLDLSTARLVTLSACETGLTEFQQTPDEYLGLPAGFLQAGAPGVVSTLWAVDDLSTMLLMVQFYQYHLQDGLEIAAALRQAQLWLRDVTAKELRERFSEERQILAGGTRMPAEVVNREYRRFALMKDEERPFAHPYYWAAFTFSGA